MNHSLLIKKMNKNNNNNNIKNLWKEKGPFGEAGLPNFPFSVIYRPNPILASIHFSQHVFAKAI